MTKCTTIILAALFSAHTAIGRAMFGEGAGTIWLDEVACSGTESELQDCAHNGVGINDCRHREDASVACVFGKTFSSYCYLASFMS